MKTKILLSSLLINSLLLATSTTIIKKDATTTFNQVDDNYKDDVGFAFYQDRNSTSIIKKKKNIKSSCDCKKIQKSLDDLLAESKKQTKIQQKILDLISGELDPKPEKIIVNGKECIANSSDKCFKMPVTAAAKRVPVLLAWIKNPTIQNSAKFLQWQAKYFKEIFKRGDSLPMALMQFGAKAYPLPIKTQGYNNLKGYDIKNKLSENMIHNLSPKYDFLIFIGINQDLDLVSVLNAVNLFKKYQDLNISIIFKDEKSKKLFLSAINSIYSEKIKALIPFDKFSVDASKFDTYQIFTTPSIVTVDKEDKKAQTIFVGSLGVSTFESGFLNYLEFNDKLDYDELNYFEKWDKNINYRDQYYRNTLGVDINKELKDNKE